MHSRIEVIQKLIDDNGYKSYLEIGYGSGECFEAIRCKHKICVDPHISAPNVKKMTSDYFFSDPGEIFDIVFIDGLHHASQVRKDIINASICLSNNGSIVLHDINPATKESQEVPCRASIWNGDVWRAWVGIQTKYRSEQWKEVIDISSYKFDHGLGIIKPKGFIFDGKFEDNYMRYEQFDQNRDKWL